ncbi:MAG: hypothetical protein CL454_08010 [Acidimicrobiaceae bacterium]|nr:hypothetical protein [Acidimicrobiaceae bacterium]MBC84787.1 hypothetical protein [Acidimicrobiaceae bacterium]|tara:strand:- start:2187 stop:2474 length:288 start_codon:yes stop_codon:yes gene_type:complete
MREKFNQKPNEELDLQERRKRVSKFVKLGKRTGYSLWLIAIVLFFVLFSTDFDGPFVAVLLVCLIAGCVILLPSIVLSYAVRAAEREDPTTEKPR